MKFLVDTCGWLEWLTDGVLADEFAPYLNDPDNLIIPTYIQYELHKCICRERDVELAMAIICECLFNLDFRVNFYVRISPSWVIFLVVLTNPLKYV